MGNRAVIKAKNNRNKAVYLHWNGGRDSVEAFLKYCELRGFRGFEDDYGMARFCQVVGNFFGADGLSIGIVDSVESPGDNGVYVVEGWRIVDRIDNDFSEQRNHDLQEMLIEIDEAQPKQQQLGDMLKSEVVAVEELTIGDEVYLQDHTGVFNIHTVIGLGEDRNVNGTNVSGVPYVNKYVRNGVYTDNINNYIQVSHVRLKERA